MREQDANWKKLTSASDTVSAEIILGRLRSEGVPTEIRSGPAILGEARLCRILVPPHLFELAQKILSEAAIPEDELEFLATGETNPDL